MFTIMCIAGTAAVTYLVLKATDRIKDKEEKESK